MNIEGALEIVAPDNQGGNAQGTVVPSTPGVNSQGAEARDKTRPDGEGLPMMQEPLLPTDIGVV